MTHIDRRSLIAAGLGTSAAITMATAAVAAGTRHTPPKHKIISVGEDGRQAAPTAPQPSSSRDVTAELQAQIDAAAAAGEPLLLPPGRILTGRLTLRPGSRIIGAAGSTVLKFAGGPAFITGDGAHGALLEDLVIDGSNAELDARETEALVHLSGSDHVELRRITVRSSTLSGVALHRCSGRIMDCTIREIELAGIRTLDAKGLEISHNTIQDCRNNGIQVWRSEQGEDSTIVSSNRIEGIAAKLGGSGEYGNGINVFRAGGVLVHANRISDCAYSAIRGNAASNIQMVANSCQRLGEVALYAEFGFEGALISSNIVDTAASGISVTNFNEGGRLAVVQGNLVRNLSRREQEPVDKRGIGISVEADSIVSGNTIERAATCGIMIGWGRYLRDCAVVQNLVRSAPVGILFSDDEGAGSAVISGNLISETPTGSIRAMNAEGDPVGADLGAEPDRKGRISLLGNVAANGDSTEGWTQWFNRG